ncbi:MAG: alkaline phosphatase [Myxococcales bacterium]|nr:alkaline phosphatase [Myxococcales bacterium]
MVVAFVAALTSCASSDKASPEGLVPQAVLDAGEGDTQSTLRGPLVRARNVVLFIGDGMGFGHLDAARSFANGNTAPLIMETLPVQRRMDTRNALGQITDSAAGATAFATGRKVSNAVLSLALPGDGRPLASALELRQASGAVTGLITRETPIVDATPAAFAAHRPSRYDAAEIAHQILRVTRPDFVAGVAAPFADVTAALEAGYFTLAGADPLGFVSIAQPGLHRVAWLYEDRHAPPLDELTSTALAFLSRHEGGFFLMVENEGTDTAGHANDLAHIVEAVLTFDRAVARGLAFAQARQDTLVLVTADHETGGVAIDPGTARAGQLPQHSFSTFGHTSDHVPVFAFGPGAEELPQLVQNHELFNWLAP